MTDARILVIIPSYNHGPFIAARVQSVLAQTDGRVDVRLVDDGSTDQTMAVLSEIRDPRLTVLQRECNSGSPFTAWTEAAEILAKEGHEYVWIAESDDRAECDFLRHALEVMNKDCGIVLHYTHSWYIDERDLILGHSINYLKRQFPKQEWMNPFILDGGEFIRDYLMNGMAIPNMSSALMRASAFCKTVRPEYRRFKLAADWIFAIEISQHGKISFDPRDANHFRHHARTARDETKAARTVVEHMMATRVAFLSGFCSRADYEKQMAIWSGMYRHEKVGRREFTELARAIDADAAGELLSFIN